MNKIEQKYFVSTRSYVKHIESKEGGLTVCGCQLEFMQQAFNEYLALPICYKCERITYLFEEK